MRWLRRMTGGALAGLLTLCSPSAFGATGCTPGAPAVSATGESSYAISFGLPRGTRGLTPQLGLVYSSGVAPSIARVGWSIAGLAATVTDPLNHATCTTGRSRSPIRAGSARNRRAARSCRSSRRPPSSSARRDCTTGPTPGRRWRSASCSMFQA